MRLSGQEPNRVDGRKVNVRGFHCEDCEYVLAVAPENANVDVGPLDESGEPTESWMPVGAIFADGSKRAIVIPSREVVV